MSSVSEGTSNPAVISDFQKHLLKSKRIVALLGAGISASSGLPTFRGAGGLWRTHDATRLATPEAFHKDPGFVWQFYSYRRHMALNAKPNRAHLALAELARKNSEFLTMSQNVDGLSPRANHPAEQLKLLHGNLFDVKCWDKRGCGYFERNNFIDPIVPALALPTDAEDDQKVVDSTAAKPNPLLKGLDISDASIPLPAVSYASLPQCPQCKKSILRPGVVWFGESLPTDVLQSVDQYFSDPQPIDLMLVIGTSAIVHPAASYIDFARHRGARVAVLNTDADEAKRLTKNDWLFVGDAAEVLPELLKPVIGEVGEFVEATDRTAAKESFEPSSKTNM